MLSSTKSCSHKEKEQNQTPLLHKDALFLCIDIKYFGGCLCKLMWESGS